MSPQNLEKCTDCLAKRRIFCKFEPPKRIPFTKFSFGGSRRRLFQEGFDRGLLNIPISECAVKTDQKSVTEYWPKNTEMMPYIAASNYGQRVWVELSLFHMISGFVVNAEVLKSALKPD